MAQASSITACLFAGLFYDMCGPRATAVASCVMCSGMMLAMVACISVPAWNSALYFAYPMVTMTGAMNVFGMYAWLWLLPEYQGLVNGLTMAVPALSDSLVLLIVLLHSDYGVAVQSSFLALAAFMLVAAVAFWWILPSKVCTPAHACTLL